MQFTETYRHKGLRRQMVEELRARKVADETTLNAMLEVPRHLFFPDQVFLEKAYEDIAFRIGAGQTISHPSTVAYQTTLLQARKGMKVLEIGTGSGYQCAVLLQLGLKVYSIERQHELFIRTRKLFESLNLKPYTFFGDGYQGQPTFAPFDRILVTAGAPFVPQALVDQLVPGGRMVIPVGEGDVQDMLVLDKDSNGNVRQEIHGEFRFVPMLEEKNFGDGTGLIRRR